MAFSFCEVKEMVKKEKFKNHQKGHVKKKNIAKLDKKKKKDRQRGSVSKGRAASFTVRETKELMTESMHLDIVNITLHFFLKDVRPMLPLVMKHSTSVA